jgi:hypothetical protein
MWMILSSVYMRYPLPAPRDSVSVRVNGPIVAIPSILP